MKTYFGLKAPGNCRKYYGTPAFADFVSILSAKGSREGFFVEKLWKEKISEKLETVTLADFLNINRDGQWILTSVKVNLKPRVLPDLIIGERIKGHATIWVLDSKNTSAQDTGGHAVGQGKMDQYEKYCPLLESQTLLDVRLRYVAPAGEVEANTVIHRINGSIQFDFIAGATCAEWLGYSHIEFMEQVKARKSANDEELVSMIRDANEYIRRYYK